MSGDLPDARGHARIEHRNHARCRHGRSPGSPPSRSRGRGGASRPPPPRRHGPLWLPRGGRGPRAGDLCPRAVAAAVPAGRRRPRLPAARPSQHVHQPAPPRTEPTYDRARRRARPDRGSERATAACGRGDASRLRDDRRAATGLPGRRRGSRRAGAPVSRGSPSARHPRGHADDPPLQGAQASRTDPAPRRSGRGKVSRRRRVLVLVTPPTRGLDVRRSNIIAALGTALATGLVANAAPAQAAVSSATISGNIVTLNLDGADDNVTVSVAGGLLVHGQTTGGLNSATDWDSTRAGDQQEPADGTFSVVVNGGDGNDSLTVLAKTSEIVSATLNGDGGDDVLTGADTNDLLAGGAGNDRLVGAKGTDSMTGGDGNDTMVWNNGDGSDRMNGEAGNDAVEVNGNPTLGDTFTMDPEPGGVKFQRTNLVPFTLDTASERFQVNGLGGDDSLTTSAGVGAATLLSVDGGAGADTINGSDGPDLILGGEGNDILAGGGGDDRIVGGPGSDTMNGGAGDDTLLWNNGDRSDILNGDAGRDDIEVNGAPTAGDVNTVQPNNGRIKFDRTNLVPFSLDIGSAETMHANGLGGDDTIGVGDVGAFSV